MTAPQDTAVNGQDPVSARGSLIIVSAPSGAGKTSLIKALVENDTGVAVSVSYTTRLPRPGEENGREYYFIDQAQFHAMMDAGEFLEYARVFDNYYGTARAAVTTQLASARDVILEIDWQGSRQIRTTQPDAVSVFVLPPSMKALRRRLEGRAQDDKAVIERRMRDALNEISHYAEYDFVIVNNDFGQALEDLRTIVRAQRLRTNAQALRHGGLIEDLRRDSGSRV